MNWEKLDIHIENLAPGLATIWALSFFWQPPAIESDASKIVLGISLLGAAYLTGVTVNVLCRVLLDSASEYLTRVYVIKVFSRGKIRDLTGASRKDVNNAYNYYCAKAIQEAKETAKEVSKRRQTGRLLRSSFIPLLIVQLHFSTASKLDVWQTIALIGFEYLILLLLYGYAETTILHEAYYAVPEEERSVKVIKQILETSRKIKLKAEQGTPADAAEPRH
jgi:hypothetical protein